MEKQQTKISELIAELQKQMQENGDVEVLIPALDPNDKTINYLRGFYSVSKTCVVHVVKGDRLFVAILDGDIYTKINTK